MRRLTHFLLSSIFFLLLMAANAWAQQRPLVTEDPETIGAGRMLVEAGFDYLDDAFYPASGLSGDLLRVPTFGVSVGVSSIAEVQIDGGFWSRLTISNRRSAPLSGIVTAAGDTTSTLDDPVVATKIRVMPESASRPAAGIRFGARLPVASRKSGLGLGTTDFFASMLLAKTVQSVRVVGNAGVVLLSDPVTGGNHDNALAYGLSFARALTNAAEVVGEINGRFNTGDNDASVASDSRGSFRFGARYTTGMLRLDAGLIVGLTARDPGFGFTGGFTYVFNAFQVP
jgi:hypothetical protein